MEVNFWARRPTIWNFLFGALSTSYQQRIHKFIPPHCIEIWSEVKNRWPFYYNVTFESQSTSMEVKFWARRPTIWKFLFGSLSTSYKERIHNFCPRLNLHSFLFSPPVIPPTFKHFVLAPAFPPSPYLSMPATPPGPWTLDKVKKRLRAEQVQREKAASARYRRQANRQQDEEAQSVKSSACQCSLLVVLTVCCLLLSLIVLVLSSVVLRVHSRKQAWKDK